MNMEALLEFAKGPLFVGTFSFMVLGLLRRVISQWVQVRASLKRLTNREIAVGANVKQSLAWLLPVKHLYRNRPFVSLMSFFFHVGLLLVPLFLVSHIDLWRRGLGIAWPGISLYTADVLTIATIVAALVLLGFRLFDRAGRTLSTSLDYFLLAAVLAPFVSGFMALHPAFNPLAYDTTMLIHVLSSELLFVLLPTTKLAHAALFIFDRFSSDVFWKMPAGAGDRVAQELYGEGRKV
jgi:nitrate reductase gamma subunit